MQRTWPGRTPMCPVVALCVATPLPSFRDVPSVDRHALKSSLLPRHTYYLWGNTVIRSGQIPKQNKPQMRSGRIQKRTYIHMVPTSVSGAYICIYTWYIHLYVCACIHAYLPGTYMPHSPTRQVIWLWGVQTFGTGANMHATRD